MFSSPLVRGRRGGAAGGDRKEISCPKRDTKTIEDPVEEFNYLLDRLRCLIEISNDAYDESIKNPTNLGPGGPLGFFRLRRDAKKKVKEDKGQEQERTKKSDQENKKEQDKEIDQDSTEEQDKETESREEGVARKKKNEEQKQQEEQANENISNGHDEPKEKDGNDDEGEIPVENLDRDEKPASVGTDSNRSNSEETPSKSSPMTPKKPPSSETPPHMPPTASYDSFRIPPHTPPVSVRHSRQKDEAYFMDMPEEDECVEILRRVVELVVIGERIVSTQITNEEKKEKHQRKQGWGDEITEDADVNLRGGEQELDPDSEQYLPIFDNFFERNGLGFIVDILTGAVFNPNNLGFETDNPNSGETTPARQESVASEAHDDYESEKGSKVPRGTWRFLPSTKIATQAVQSVSILVQNVSRATSLYFVLSNNHINELIELPLDLYFTAERNRLEAEGKHIVNAGKTFTTPELQELTTHFVTFLKSLAMRMNTETLQFFLKYPSHTNDDESSVETKAKAIEFPLYARALDFCAAHHDSFVRVTAMNICLNTLRLTTVAAIPGEENEDQGSNEPVGSSPDGVLHSAKPLPFRESLAIATHTCAPSRVTRLASPIFTKLAQLWGLLEEKFVDLDTPLREEDLFVGKSKVPIDPIKERERKLSNFREVAANLQDQLELLNDLLKVGLTALNEQIIEMMLATFVYPLLLQPLLVYYQQLPDTSGEPPAILDPFSERALDRVTVDFNQIGRAPPQVTAPAKAAMFTLASVFHLITNRPLIRLLYTAVFHPLSPDISNETVVNAEGSVTRVDANGKKTIRVDGPVLKGGDEKVTYPFGGKKSEASSLYVESEENQFESCIFVLSPALAEVLSYSGQVRPLATFKTRSNPYRLALLQCLEMPHHMADFRKLSVMTVDAALSLFDGKFLSETLLGGDLGSGASTELPKSATEVILALCGCLVNGRNGPFGTWRLDFDYVAAHALLCSIWRSPKGLIMAERIVEERYWKAAGLLAEIPARIPTTQHLGTIMNLIFYEAGTKRRKATYEDLFHMKDTAAGRFSTAIASGSTFHLLSSRGYEAPPTPEALNTFNENTVMVLGSSSCRAILKLDALSTFLKVAAKNCGSAIQDVSPYGFALTDDRGLVDTKGCFIDDLARSVHCFLSKDFCDALTDATDGKNSEQPLRGSIVVLSGRTAMPCVCEASSRESNSEGGAKMVVEGVTWQSLYLVFFGSYMVLAEPAPGSPGKGRVVSSCPLSRLAVARDPNQPADPSSPARRILMAHRWFDTKAPDLFLFDEEPKEESYGPFNKVRMWRSKLDVWFEDDGAAAHAYHSISFQIENARSRRGDRILDYLTQQRDVK